MKNDSYYIAELEDKILEVVWSQTKDIPRPWGLILSGGFDSGLLAALTKPDYIYNIRFPYGPRYDESRYADAIIKHLGLSDKTTIITFTKEDFLPNLREAVKIMGEPISHFSLAPFNLLMHRIRQRARMPEVNILSGEGPDEYLGGYARQIIFDELKKLYEIPELRNYHSSIRRLIAGLIEPAINDNIDDDIGKEEIIEVYQRYMKYDENKISDWWVKNENENYPLQGKIGKMDMELGVIEKMEQKLAKAHGVNLHYPYINQVFAEYCYMLPDHLKIRNGVTKWAFRQVCKKYLPEMMWDRSKMGGPVAPVNQWIEGSNGEFDKTAYIKLQEDILHEKA